MKKIQDYIHLYFGCDMFVIKTGEVISLDDLQANNHWPVWTRDKKYCNEKGSVSEGFSFKEVKLVLRSLSDIKIEEAAYCLHQVFFPHNPYYPITDFKLVFNNYGNPVISIDNDWFDESLTFGVKTGSIWSAKEKSLGNTKIPAYIFAYLLKQGFDLFGLIEAGLAIDKTTLKNTEA